MVHMLVYGMCVSDLGNGYVIYKPQQKRDDLRCDARTATDGVVPRLAPQALGEGISGVVKHPMLVGLVRIGRIVVTGQFTGHTVLEHNPGCAAVVVLIAHNVGRGCRI